MATANTVTLAAENGTILLLTAGSNGANVHITPEDSNVYIGGSGMINNGGVVTNAYDISAGPFIVTLGPNESLYAAYPIGITPSTNRINYLITNSIGF